MRNVLFGRHLIFPAELSVATVATSRSLLLQLCQAGCECIHYLVGSHHNSEQGLKVFVRITSWGGIPSLVETVPCAGSRDSENIPDVEAADVKLKCGECTIVTPFTSELLAATFILFLCRNYTVAHIGLMSHILVNPPTPHTTYSLPLPIYSLSQLLQIINI